MFEQIIASRTIKETTTPPLTVSQLSQLVKRSLEQGFSKVIVEGEISGLKIPSSGHIYFTLKDEGAVLAAIMWRGQAAKLPQTLKDGDAVVCTGELTTYPGRSQYQLIVNEVKLAGVGALMAMLAERKAKLLAEGLFSTDYKRALPKFPTRIGVITSPTGAVIRDILHRLSERYPVKVSLWPVAVQGETTVNEVCQAIKGFNRLAEEKSALMPDVIIIARGGGSFEDLWPFNDEAIVRAAFASNIPIISAIGHETDNCLLDLVADLRAPTPTAAAEIATPSSAELKERLRKHADWMVRAARRHIMLYEQNLQLSWSRMVDPKTYVSSCEAHVAKINTQIGFLVSRSLTHHQHNYKTALVRLRLVNLSSKLNDYQQQLARCKQLQARMMIAIYQQSQLRLAHVLSMLKSLDYRNILKRGFTMLRDADGKLVCSKKSLSNGKYSVEFHDGRAELAYPATGTGIRSAKKPSGANVKQLGLFE